MKLITARTQILSIVDDYARWMENKDWASRVWTMEEKRAILHKLQTLDLTTATPDEVNSVTKAPYIKMTCCDECNRESWDVVEIGEEPNHNTRTAYICKSCINTAFKLF